MQPLTQLDDRRPVHFVGIGGIGMSGLARLLHEVGFQVSGSDARQSEQTQALAALGIRVAIGHAADNLPADAQVVLSTAIDADNPERQAADARQLPQVHRSAVLQFILHHPRFAHRDVVGVAGSHGKTTVTGMVGLALAGASLDPTVVAGGLLPGVGVNAVLGTAGPDGQRRVAVAELDESDQSLTAYAPTIALINNIELDHPDHYPGGLPQLVDVFRQFLDNLPDGATVILNAECPVTREHLGPLPERLNPVWLAMDPIALVGLRGQHYAVRAAHVGPRGGQHAHLLCQGDVSGTLQLSVPGRHNLFNALATVAIADRLGADRDEILSALEAFPGMGRRFEVVSTEHNALWVDDYAHHPTEVAATLQAARDTLLDDEGRVLAVFQPHRYSRLQSLWDGFREAFNAADLVYITDVYGAGEAPMPGVDGEALARALTHPKAVYVPKTEWARLRHQLLQAVRPGDRVLSMGAGDITRLFRQWDPVA